MALFKKDKDIALTGDSLLTEIVISDDEKAEVQKIVRRNQAGYSYYQSTGFYDQCALAERFWNAEQWPAVTKKTKNFPRPVTNFYAEIIDQKVAGILYELPEIHFLAIDSDVGPRYQINVLEQEEGMGGEQGENIEDFDISASEMLSLMAKQEAQRMELDSLLDDACRTAAQMGSPVLYFPFDNTLIGGGRHSRWIGNIVGVEIDPTDFIVGDPTQKDLQLQPWIQVNERLPLSSVKEIYQDFETDKVKSLKSEQDRTHHRTYSQQTVELDETDMVNLIHQWERKRVVDSKEITNIGEDGEEKTTTVKRYRFQVSYKVICQEMIIRQDNNIKITRYPFVSFQWYPKRKSFVGKSESVDLIPNQKNYNRLLGMGLLGAFQTGLPNIWFKEPFVRKEDIPHGGGGIIKDTSPPGQMGVGYMQPPTSSYNIDQLKEILKGGAKESAGVHEAWSGKAPSAQLNASAIIALQEAAGVRIRGIQRRLHRAMKDIGRIWLEYWKVYYTEDRMYRLSGTRSRSKIEGVIWFNGTALQDMEFDIEVSASGASPYSKSVINASLTEMIQYKAIDGDEYLEMLPGDVFPKAQEMLRRREEKREVEQMMMQQQQLEIVNQVVAQVVKQAAAAGVEITPEALDQMQAMIGEADQQQSEGVIENV